MTLLPRGRRVFVDTGAFAALSMEREADYRSAVVIARRLAEARFSQVTTNFVVAETHALVLARAGRDAALRALREIEGPGRTIIRVDEDHERRARAILVQYHDKDFTLVDAMSFAVMEQLGISTAFAFDHHFQQFGFQLAD
jgi:predicted nucleic acid-binding protein